MLSLVDVSAGYGSFRALFGVSLEVAAGETVGVIGPNGAGKTTLMRVISGLVAASAGAISLDGRSIVGIASAHATPAGDKLLRSLQRVYRVSRDNLQSTVAQVVRTGQPSLRRTITHEAANGGPPGSVADIHRRLACRSALVLPMCVGEIVTGAVSLCYAQSGRTYARADLAGARRIAREIARLTAPPLPHAAPRLRAPTGDARRDASVRRRVAPRN